MSEPGYSPLARLVLAMVCLSVAGTCVAGAHYFAIDLPEQNNLQAPLNHGDGCILMCSKLFSSCQSLCNSNDRQCQKTCEGEYSVCKAFCQ